MYIFFIISATTFWENRVQAIRTKPQHFGKSVCTYCRLVYNLQKIDYRMKIAETIIEESRFHGFLSWKWG